MIFSLEELKDIEKDCAIYVGRMERVARHSSISKEEKVRGHLGPRAWPCASRSSLLPGWAGQWAPLLLRRGRCTGAQAVRLLWTGEGFDGKSFLAWHLVGSGEMWAGQTPENKWWGGGERWRCRRLYTPLEHPGLALRPCREARPLQGGHQAWGLGPRLLWESVSTAWEPASPLCGAGTVPPEPSRGLSGPLSQAVPGAREGGLDASITGGLFQELRMEIAKQELIVQAREAASRVLSALSGACGSGPPLCRGAACWGCS